MSNRPGTIQRLTTRSIATATAIRDREDFRTSGALMGESTSVGRYDSGRLSGADYDQFILDAPFIDYVVTSYATPIAWHYTDLTGTRTGWHVVAQKFSLTTTKHQGNLYLIPRCSHCGTALAAAGEDCPNYGSGERHAS